MFPCDHCKTTNTVIFEIELLTTVGWKWGCQPFSCRCSQNVTHCRKELCSTCLFKASFPAIPFGNSNRKLPTRSRFLRAAVRSTCSALWLHHAHPFVAATKKSSPCREAEVLVTELWFPRFVTYNTVIMPVTVKFTVKFRLDFLVCGLQGEVLWHFAMLAPCFPSHEALKNCRD